MTERAREAFAAAENHYWAERPTGWEQWTPGRGFVPCAAPEPLSVYRESARTRHSEAPDQDVVLGSDSVFSYPLVSSARLPDDARALKYLEKWAGMNAEAKASFLTRAGRNISEDNHKKFLEYGGYCLFARGRISPVSLGVFQKFRGECNKTKGLKATKGRIRT